METTIEAKQEKDKSLYRILTIVSYIITAIFWVGLAFVIFVILFVTPRFRDIYSELQASLPLPTQLIVNYKYLSCLFVILYAISPILIRKKIVTQYKSIGLIIFLGLGIFSIGVIIGFIVVALYIPLFRIVNEIK